jgi:hypothetical protein
VSTPSTFDSDAPRSNSLATAERIYRVILRAYPDAFRAEYEREMTQLFLDQWREGGGDVLHFWTNVVWDLVRSAPPLRVEAWRARGRRTTRTLGETMKLVAILTVLFGLFGALSAVSEGVIVARQGALGAAYTLSVVLSVIAGALLLAAGVAALRGTPSGQRTASRAAIASLVVFVLARLVFGWMSIFAQLAGILLPLAALAVLHQPLWRRTAS